MMSFLFNVQLRNKYDDDDDDDVSILYHFQDIITLFMHYQRYHLE